LCGIGTQATPTTRLKRWTCEGSGSAAYPYEFRHQLTGHTRHTPQALNVGRLGISHFAPKDAEKGVRRHPFLTHRNPSPLKEPHNRVFVVVQVCRERGSTFRPVPNKPPEASLNLWPVSTVTRQEHKELNLWAAPSQLGKERCRTFVSKSIYSIPHSHAPCQYPWGNWRGRVYEIPLRWCAATSYSILPSRMLSSSIVFCDTQFSPFACPAPAQVV
jgi:hypothetical protein